MNHIGGPGAAIGHRAGLCGNEKRIETIGLMAAQHSFVQLWTRLLACTRQVALPLQVMQSLRILDLHSARHHARAWKHKVSYIRP
jgi:hypothetical protein